MSDGWRYQSQNDVVFVYVDSEPEARALAEKHLGRAPDSEALPLPGHLFRQFFKVPEGAVVSGRIFHDANRT